MYRFIKFLLIFIMTISSLQLSCAGDANIKSNQIQKRLNELSLILNTHLLIIKPIDKKDLPAPYDFLLTQPLLTLAIEDYFKRTPVIHLVHKEHNPDKNTYSRVITMFLDLNRKRNDAELAMKLNEGLVVELALITINFNELPQELIDDILNSNIPFGKLLKVKKIPTFSTNQYYFSTICNSELVRILKCNLNSPILGRINTLVKADNNKPIAQVVELLAGLECKDKECTVILNR